MDVVERGLEWMDGWIDGLMDGSIEDRSKVMGGFGVRGVDVVERGLEWMDGWIEFEEWVESLGRWCFKGVRGCYTTTITQQQPGASRL